MADKERLTRRQLHALPFLISSPTVQMAAKQAGISAKQMFDWLNYLILEFYLLSWNI